VKFVTKPYGQKTGPKIASKALFTPQNSAKLLLTNHLLGSDPLTA
jgi:hypothetical protein